MIRHWRLKAVLSLLLNTFIINNGTEAKRQIKVESLSTKLPFMNSSKPIAVFDYTCNKITVQLIYM